MRWLSVWIVMMFLVPAVPGEPIMLPLDLLPPTVVLEDAVGDVTGTPVPLGGPSFIDIERVEMELLEDALRFSVAIADPTALTNYEGSFHDAPVWLGFETRGTQFLAVIRVQPSPAEVNEDELFRPYEFYRLEGQSWRLQFRMDPVAEFDQGLFHMHVPYERIQDLEGFPISPGDVVTPLALRSQYHAGGVYFDPNRDIDPGEERVQQQRYNDMVEIPADAVLPLGVQEVTDILLTAATPVKFSNGGGSFHWELEIRNLGDEPHVLHREWMASEDVELEAPAFVSMEAGETKVIHLYATLPSRHEHGGEDEVVSIGYFDGPIGARTEVAVRYLLVPQPAGHHDTVYLHGWASGAPGREDIAFPDGGVINTQEFYEGWEASGVEASVGVCRTSAGGANSIEWIFRLSPGLRIGLDAEMDKTGLLEFSFESGLPLAGELWARLQLRSLNNGEKATLREADEWTAVQDVQLEAQSSQSFVIDLPMPPELDRVEPQTNMPNLFLNILVCPTEQAEQVLLADQFVMATNLRAKLPLVDYKEVLDVSPTIDGLMLSTESVPVEAEAGRAILFEIAMDAQPGPYSLAVVGPDAQRFELLSKDHVEGSTTAWVAAFVPEDSKAGALIQAFFLVSDDEAPDRTALLPLAIEVVEDAERDDSAEIANLRNAGDRATPFPLVSVLGLLLIVGILRRRD